MYLNEYAAERSVLSTMGEKAAIMNLDRKYLLCGLGYAIAGMCLGIYMGVSKNHAQFVTHAHILLVGFVLSFIYGAIHKLWLGERVISIAKIQFAVHNAGAVTMITGLFLMFGSFVPDYQIGPVLGIASVVVLAGLLIMTYMVLTASASR
jgi:hypothetical protein